MAANPITLERVQNVILMVYLYGGCTAEHIRRCYFSSHGARSACYAWIARLVKDDYLVSTRLPSLTGIGSGKAFLTTGPNARPLLAKALGIPRTELARMRMDSPFMIAHHIALCDIRLSFELAAKRSPFFTLQDWVTDAELKRLPVERVKDPKDENREIALIPDARFTLAVEQGTEQTFLAELDLSNLSPKRLRTKLRGFLKVKPPPVLFIVPDRQRQAAIAQWAAEEARDMQADPTIFWLATKDSINESTVFSAPIWQIVGGPAALALDSLAHKEVF
jgi:hypothetical protein